MDPVGLIVRRGFSLPERRAAISGGTRAPAPPLAPGTDSQRAIAPDRINH